MEISLYDLVVDELVERQQLVKQELAERFKKTKPFRMEPVDPAEMLYEYNTMTPEKMDGLINTFGRESVNDLIYNMENLKKKKQGGV